MPTTTSSRLLITLVAAAAIAGCGSDRPSPSASSDPVNAGLLHAAAVAARFSTSAGFPFASTLASELHLTDPRTSYQPLRSPAEVPAPRAIGVYASATTLWLSARGTSGNVIELRRVILGVARGTYGPKVVSPSALIDGDFTTPVSDGWTIQRGQIASVARDEKVFHGGPAALHVVGSGAKDRVATTVSQTISRLGSHTKGTTFTVDFLARTQGLSRPLLAESKLVYADGTYEFFLAAPRSSTGAVGIPDGSSKGWIPLQSEAVARKPVASLIVYAVDTGATPLRGSAWIDDVTLAEARP